MPVCEFNQCYLPGVILASLFGILLLLVIYSLFQYRKLARILMAIERTWNAKGTCYQIETSDQCRLYANDVLGDVPQTIVQTSFNPKLAWLAADYVSRVEMTHITTPPNNVLIKNLFPNEGPIFGTIWKNGTALVIAFRGTSTNSELQDDIDSVQVDVDTGIPISAPLNSYPDINGKTAAVHQGFLNVTHRFYADVSKQVDSISPPICYLFGHSLGGCVATLTSVLLAEQYPNIQFVCINFGTPRISNGKFNERVLQLTNLTIWRVINSYDLIAQILVSVCPNFKRPKEMPYFYEYCGKEQIYSSNYGSWRKNHFMPNYVAYLKALNTQ